MIWPHLLVVPIMLPLTGAILAAALRGRLSAWVALGTSLLVLMTSATILYFAYVGGPQVYRIGGWAPPYGIVLVADLFGSTLAVTSAVVATASTLYVATSSDRHRPPPVYNSLFLLLLTALGGVFLTGDLFNLYVFMEMVILSSFALVAMANRRISAEVTFKYAVLSAMGSLLFLVGLAFVYAAVGTLNLADIAQRVSRGSPAPFWGVAGAMILFAFLLKGACFPFHFWQPDAHSAASPPVSAILSGVLVKVGFYGVTRMSTLLFPDTLAMQALVPLGIASAIFGGLGALANPNLKRLLAYSTIANMGFILLALGWGGVAGLLAAMVATINHALIKASLFLTGGYVADRLGEQAVDRLGGLARVTPGGAALFGLGALALAGLPPLSGFLSKVTLIQAGLAVQDSAALAIAIGASALSIAYSLRAFALVFWGETPAWAMERWVEQPPEAPLIAPTLLVLLFVFLGLWPDPLYSLATAIALELQEPSRYIVPVLGGAT